MLLKESCIIPAILFFNEIQLQQIMCFSCNWMYIFYESYIKQHAHSSISFCLNKRYANGQKDLPMIIVIEEFKIQT